VNIAGLNGEVSGAPKAVSKIRSVESISLPFTEKSTSMPATTQILSMVSTTGGLLSQADTKICISRMVTSMIRPLRQEIMLNAIL